MYKTSSKPRQKAIVHLGLKIHILGMGSIALYNGITRSCIIALLLKNVMN